MHDLHQCWVGLGGLTSKYQNMEVTKLKFPLSSICLVLIYTCSVICTVFGIQGLILKVLSFREGLQAALGNSES